VWETDHMQAPVQVEVEGRARRPWITWFTDCATNAITGVAVTPVHPSRESVLAALRSAVLREDPYGPFGGLPEKVRVDRGKDFLSRTVTAAFDLLDVTVEDLPAYTPHLKGTVEGLNRAVEGMFLAALPGYARQPRPGKRASHPKDEVLLGFEDFTARLLDWTRWWNTEHRPALLRGQDSA
jgi:Integrase core domain.